MNSIAPVAVVKQAEETEKQIVALAKAAIAKESDCKWSVGRLAHEWTERFAKGRTDGDFAELVGLSRRAVQHRRQVYEAYGDVWNSSSKLTWTHYRETLDWSDAEEWLAEADKHGWSVATMKSQREEVTVGAEAVDLTADVTSDADACGADEDSNGLPHSGTADVPNAAPPSKRVAKAKAKAKAEGTGRESRPLEPEPSHAKLLVDQADSVARFTIPGIIEAGNSFNEFLVQHERTGVDIDKVKSLSTALTEIFFAAKGEISRCK
ncbi:MAG: hypothetical protein ACKVHE_25705 [Planctomycetales bacterium]